MRPPPAESAPTGPDHPQDVDRNVATEFAVVRAIDLAHAGVPSRERMRYGPYCRPANGPRATHFAATPASTGLSRKLPACSSLEMGISTCCRKSVSSPQAVSGYVRRSANVPGQHGRVPPLAAEFLVHMASSVLNGPLISLCFGVVQTRAGFPASGHPVV